ncbi:DUF5701 family protein [Pseudactinotalea suaedae]|uniref:DUF5701 family protein n=1 Tax=Pseudactinotalea suaedae TaxID=1524924 RepID=UPI0012E1B74B|nr:DUF5701 family protein [Pseudactinotalea suaedae]
MPTTAAATDRTTVAELERQLENLFRLGYPALMKTSETDLRSAVERLAARLPDRPSAVRPEDHVPFVIVPAAAPLRQSALLMTKDDRPATLMIEDEHLGLYAPIEAVDLPDAPVYLLTDIDTGSDLTNVTPETAVTTILGRGRTPLTIAEGIALVTQRPDMLRKNKCFSLPASRRGNQQVPAIWISQRAPKLGWCWDRNPHTWLGSASAGERIAG